MRIAQLKDERIREQNVLRPLAKRVRGTLCTETERINEKRLKLQIQSRF